MIQKLTLEQWRLLKGLTLQEVSERVGVTSVTLRSWEKRGKVSIPNLKKLMDIYEIEDSSEILLEPQRMWNTHKKK